MDTSDVIQREIYLRGVWDEGVGGAVRSKIKPGVLFVDVGAHVGYYSLLAASLGAHVIALEPNPPVFEALEANIALNGFSIDARMIGVGEHSGSAILHTACDSNPGAATLRAVDGTQCEIQLDRLDHILTEAPTLMKLDVEGSEVAALRGAGDRLGPFVIVEVSEFSLLEMGSSKDELFDLMGRKGYTAEILSPVRRSNATNKSVYFQYDVLFSRPT